MLRQKTITVIKETSLSRRISEVSQQIRNWLNSLEKTYNVETDKLRLASYTFSRKEHIYRYEITQADGKNNGIKVFPEISDDLQFPQDIVIPQP